MPPCAQILHLRWWNRLGLACRRRLAQLAALDPLLHCCTAKEQKMPWMICAILVVLWALGMATAYTASGLIHLLLVVALAIVIIRVLQGRRILS